MVRLLIRPALTLTLLATLAAGASAAPRLWPGSLQCIGGAQATMEVTARFPRKQVVTFTATCGQIPAVPFDTSLGDVQSLNVVVTTGKGRLENICTFKSQNGYIDGRCLVDMDEGIAAAEMLISIPNIP